MANRSLTEKALCWFGFDLTEKHWRCYQKALHAKSRISSLYYHYLVKRMQRQYVADIPVSETIEPFSAPHGIAGIFISAGAHIGRNCTIFQQVTIGSNTLKDSKGFGAPTIEEDCLIGAGAKLIGNIHVGKGVRIGANCVVTHDVPAYATVVLGSPRIIEHEQSRVNCFVPWDKKGQSDVQQKEVQ